MTMKEIYSVSADSLLKGKAKPEDLTAKYVILYQSSFSQIWEKLTEAMNFLAKFGWRAVGYSGHSILIEHMD
ncbi:MAG: hypothetical protein ACFFCO_07155 [Promethearchaeota archaeon]